MKSKTFSRLIVFVSLSLLFIGLGIFSAASQDKITRKTINAMSFNIRYDNPKDNENAWPNRKEMVAATIRFHQTDIAGLQEALDHQVKDLEALLPEYGWFGVGRDDGRNKGEYAPVFFRKGRFTVVHWDTFWLSDTPDKPAKAWDAALPRIVTWGKIQDIWTGKIFFFFNTHFDHVGETAREKSAKLLQKKIAEISEDFPVILTGDFNCTEKENPYKTLTSGNGQKPTLSDVYALSESKPYGSVQTYNGFRETIQPDRRIDFIFVTLSVRILRCGTISEKWDGRFVSDHNAVLAEILFIPQGIDRIGRGSSDGLQSDRNKGDKYR
jgi:endonuclease/exonuclease/phosphatase family metal-dependent hydrolase